MPSAIHNPQRQWANGRKLTSGGYRMQVVHAAMQVRGERFPQLP